MLVLDGESFLDLLGDGGALVGFELGLEVVREMEELVPFQQGVLVHLLQLLDDEPQVGQFDFPLA